MWSCIGCLRRLHSNGFLIRGECGSRIGAKSTPAPVRHIHVWTLLHSLLLIRQEKSKGVHRFTVTASASLDCYISQQFFSYFLFFTISCLLLTHIFRLMNFVVLIVVRMTSANYRVARLLTLDELTTLTLKLQWRRTRMRMVHLKLPLLVRPLEVGPLNFLRRAAQLQLKV